MPTIEFALKDLIRKTCRREINSQTKKTRRLVTLHRRDLAELKRQMTTLINTVTFLEKQEKKRVGQAPATQEIGKSRFRADGLRSHRAKIGISARDYGKLIGVSGVAVYQWETGTFRPRAAQIAKLLTVRGIGRREALKRLEMMN